MNKADAKRVVHNAVAITEPRWRNYAFSWKRIDTMFIQSGYEQQGFKSFRFLPLLEKQGILSISALGSILDDRLRTGRYDNKYAKGSDAPFYRQLRAGTCGNNGRLFAEAARLFSETEPRSCGRFYWMYLWYMLQACSYLRNHHDSSFATYLVNGYRRYARKPGLSEEEFLAITDTEWRAFLESAKPWQSLKGIGVNVFDFIVGDIVEARFARDSYKFDSANQHFLKVTGIASLITPLARIIHEYASTDVPRTSWK